MAAAIGENRALRDQFNVINRQFAALNTEYGVLRDLVTISTTNAEVLNRLKTFQNQLGAIATQADAIKAQNLNDPNIYDPVLAASLDTLSNNIITLQNGSQQLVEKANGILAQQSSQPVTQPGTVPPATGEEKPLTGVADEDNGQGQANTAGSGAVPSAPTSTANGQGGTTGGTDNVAQGADGQATSNEDSFGTDESSPGKRLKNPLGNFSSYTYQLSLYMITPDAYNAFIESGRRRINAFNEATAGEDAAGGAFLIAQSGGINNQTSKRAPGFDFDYGIDNLSFKTNTSGKSNQTESNVTDIKFTIIEPYGFSFLTKLRNASDALIGYANQMGMSGPENPSKQFFILGIRFFGYDEAGNIITGRENYDGNTLDPNASGNGIFETFYDINITSIKFKLDGRATTYTVSAVSLGPQAAFSVKRGLINSNKEVSAATAGEAIDQLFEKLNKEQLDMQKNKSIKYPNTYSVVYLGDARKIAEASLVSPEDLDKFKFPGSGAKSTTQSNDAAAVRSQPDTTKRNITFNQGTPVLKAINNIVTQSSFLRDALKVVYTTAIEPPKTGGAEENKPGSKRKIQWYNCSAEISNAVWDDMIADWAYDITYVIQTYETPVIDSSYANPGGTYYGPHKRYEYWYSGKNSEVIAYEQNLDNTYYNTVLDGGTGSETNSAGNATPETSSTASNNGQGNASNGPTGVSKRPGQRTNQPRLGKLGNAMEAQNSYLTSLFDPGAYATAKITILGDPDFLIQDQTSSENEIYSRFYGSDGFTISANGGQVYIEIDFKEAVDYESETGVLNINDRILFWKYPENISKKVKGVSYMLVAVNSTFANGSFKQVLECTINDFGDPAASNSQDNRESITKPSATTGPAPGNTAATTSASGLKPDNPSNQTAPAAANASGNPTAAPQQNTTPTNTGPVADDDGNG